MYIIYISIYLYIYTVTVYIVLNVLMYDDRGYMMY